MKRKNSGPTRYAIYLRCSSDDQAHGDFTTIDTQRDINRIHVKQLCGTVVKEYSDEGKSGTHLKRSGWQSLLRDAQDGQFDAVCVTYMSRLARGEVYHIAEYLLKENDVRVELVRENFTPDLAGHVNKQMTILMDGMYPKMVSQWTRTKMEQMVANAYWCGNLPSLGYRMETIEGAVVSKGDKEPPKRLIVHPEEADIVRFAYRLFLEKRKIAAVRDYLRSVTPREWTTDTTKRVLTNEVYLGIQVFGQWRNETAHEAIVDRETWDKVNALIQTGGQPRPVQCTDYTFYLRGLIVCPHCGCNYSPYSAKSGEVRYYSCLHSQKRRSQCPVKWLNANALHYTVLHAIYRAAKHETIMHKLLAQSRGWSRPEADLQTLRGQLAKKKGLVIGQITNVVNVLADGRGKDALLDRLQKLEAEQAALHEELELLEQEIAAKTFYRPTAKEVQTVWSEVLDLWDYVEDSDKGIVLSSIVKQIVATKKDRVVLRLSPVAELHDPKFVLQSQMGAGNRPSYELCPASHRVYPQAI